MKERTEKNEGGKLMRCYNSKGVWWWRKEGNDESDLRSENNLGEHGRDMYIALYI